jgi:hypothetical protein
VANIVELIRGNVEAVRHEAREVSTSLSAVQTLKEGLGGVKKRLAEMEELTERASSRDHNKVQVDEMQGQLARIIESVKQATENTKHGFNRVFSSKGESFSLAVGDGSHIDIFAKDLAFDGEGLDLRSDPAAAKAAVVKAMKELAEYGSYLDKQMTDLAKATERLEQDMVGAMGLESNDFTPVLAGRVASDIAGEAAKKSKEAASLMNAQANANPSRALQLLKDVIQQSQQPSDRLNDRAESGTQAKTGRENTKTGGNEGRNACLDWQI